MERIFKNALICILIAVCVLLCALPNRSAIDTDHSCSGEICLVCLVSALSSSVSVRLFLLTVSSLPLLLLRCVALFSHAAKDYTRKDTPVYLKVKLLN